MDTAEGGAAAVVVAGAGAGVATGAVVAAVVVPEFGELSARPFASGANKLNAMQIAAR